jgi:uncharacterized membrane protein
MDIVAAALRVFAELFFVKTGALVLRAISFGHIAVVPEFSFLPFKRRGGTIAAQEWIALLIGMMFWIVIGTFVVARLT